MQLLLHALLGLCWQSAYGIKGKWFGALWLQSLRGRLERTSIITGPVAEYYSQLRVRRIDTVGMVPMQERTPPQWPVAESNVTIMGYQPEQDEEISGSLIKSGGDWEKFHLGGLCEPWKGKGVLGNFLDVGANIGTYTLPMAACLAGKGQVIAVEGMPSIADHLRAGIVANRADNVALYNYAVGEWTNASQTTMLLNATNKGASSVMGNKLRENQTGSEMVNVSLTTLDAILNENPRMKALMVAKIDIEGNEGRMMKGAEELFSKYAPCWLTIELIPEWLQNAGTPVEDVLKKLRKSGYVRVPWKGFLWKARWRSKTIHVYQKDWEGCQKRVTREYKAQVQEVAVQVVGMQP